MLSQTRKIHHTLVRHLPYSRIRGRLAHARGRGETWAGKAQRAAALLDAMASFLLLGSAALALAAMGFSNGWFAAGGGIALGLALFTMAATIWIDQQITAVEDHVYLLSKSPREDPSGKQNP